MYSDMRNFYRSQNINQVYQGECFHINALRYASETYLPQVWEEAFRPGSRRAAGLVSLMSCSFYGKNNQVNARWFHDNTSINVLICLHDKSNVI